MITMKIFLVTIIVFANTLSKGDCFFSDWISKYVFKQIPEDVDDSLPVKGEEELTLDNCLQVIAAKMRTGCPSMSEETLGKLSVNLVNCQAAYEGRPFFKCTFSMTLRNCTRKLTPVMRKAFKLVNEGARAVCYPKRNPTPFNLNADQPQNNEGFPEAERKLPKLQRSSKNKVDDEESQWKKQMTCIQFKCYELRRKKRHLDPKDLAENIEKFTGTEETPISKE